MPFWPKGKGFDDVAALKRGFTFHDFEKRLPSVPDLLFWFGRGNRKLAIVTSSKLVCCDFDSIKMYFRFVADYPEFINTFTVQTPAIDKPSPKCYHVYFWLNEPIEKPVEATWEDVEIKHLGDNVITHGEGYQTINSINPMKLESINSLPFVKEKEDITPQEGIQQIDDFLKNLCTSSRGKMTTNIEASYAKKHIRIENYLGKLGHKFHTTSGGLMVTNCPFHDDKHPSFYVMPKVQRATCNKPGCVNRNIDVFDLHMRLFGGNFSTVIYELSSVYGLI